jgi:hypothetical protein
MSLQTLIDDPALSPPAALKPLLNPLQTGDIPSASTIVEPPRSPAAADPASIEVVDHNADEEMSVEQSIQEPVSLVMSSEQTTLPPLPIDAPVPPTPPEPKDEVLPIPPADLIPNVVPPSVITVETPAPPDSIPGSFPTPAGMAFDPIPSPIPVDEPMAEIAHPAMSSASSTGSLKRNAEMDLGGRDEKRAKEEPVAESATPPAPINYTPIPGQPIPPWLTYVPGPARPAGSTTPLTVTQHKHLLNSVRTLKKAKDAGVFHVPVDIVLFGIPHYPQVISKPMDLGTVETKLIASDPRGPPKDKSKLSKWDESKGRYQSASEVIADVRQIWENTRIFNGPIHFVTVIADRMDETFEKAISHMPAEVSVEKGSTDDSPHLWQCPQPLSPLLRPVHLPVALQFRSHRLSGELPMGMTLDQSGKYTRPRPKISHTRKVRVNQNDETIHRFSGSQKQSNRWKRRRAISTLSAHSFTLLRISFAICQNMSMSSANPST